MTWSRLRLSCTRLMAKKLNDGDSFTVKLNNGALTISVKDKTLNVELEPDRDAAGDTPYELDMTLGIYKEKNDG